MTSLLSFEIQEPVSWASKGRFGEGGREAWRIDASGLSLRNRMIHHELIPASSDISLQTRIRYKSSLVSNDNGFEGFAIRHRGWQVTGSGKTHKQVWDSNPTGRRNWIAKQKTDWTTGNFLVGVPSNLGIEYVTWELVVRASAGQLTLSTIECRHAYVKPLNGILSTTYTEYTANALSRQQMTNETATSMDDQYRDVRYLSEELIDISEGQQITFNLVGAAMGGSYQGFSGGRVLGRCSIIAKLTKKEGGAVHYFLGEGEPSVNQTRVFQGTTSVRASSDFMRIEYLAGMSSVDDPAPTLPAFFIYGVLVEGHVGDFTAPSQSA